MISVAVMYYIALACSAFNAGIAIMSAVNGSWGWAAFHGFLTIVCGYSTWQYNKLLDKG